MLIKSEYNLKKTHTDNFLSLRCSQFKCTKNNNNLPDQWKLGC